MERKKFASLISIALLIFIIVIVGTVYSAYVSAGDGLQTSVTSSPISAVLPAVSPSTSASTYSVITANYSGILYDLYCPSKFSGSLVILAGGIQGDKKYLGGWETVLAQNGYAVLGFSTKAEDLEHVAQYAYGCINNIQTLLPFVFNASQFPISINQNSVSLVGMSGGGAAVLSISDPHIKAVVAVCLTTWAA